MEINPANLKAATNAFNTIKVSRGQFTSIATSDAEGNPNVAPIGSMRVVDRETVHMLQGYLFRTLRNLRQNPKATFSVCLRPKLLEMLRDGDKPLGYQLGCELVGIDETDAAVRAETFHILRRVPFLLRRPFAKFCDKNLRRVLKFKILEVRAIGVPE